MFRGDDDDEEEEDDFLIEKENKEKKRTREEEEEIDGCFQYLKFRLFYPDEYKMKQMKRKQLMVYSDLTKQRDYLCKEIKKLENETNPLQDTINRLIARVRDILNICIKKHSSMRNGFNFKDLKKLWDETRLMLPIDDRLIVSNLLQKQAILKQANNSIQLLNVQLNQIENIRTKCQENIKNIQLGETIRNVNVAMERILGVDLSSYSKQVCEDLSKVSERIGLLSNSSIDKLELEEAMGDVLSLDTRGENEDSLLETLLKEAIQLQQPSTINNYNYNNNPRKENNLVYN